MNRNQKIRIRAVINKAYSNQLREIVWTKPMQDAEITNLDTWTSSNDITLKSKIGVAFKKGSTSTDQELLHITVLMAKRLILKPTDRQILREILAGLDGIGAL